MADDRVRTPLDHGLRGAHRDDAGPARSERAARSDVHDEPGRGDGEARERNGGRRRETSCPALDQRKAGESRRHEQDQERRGRLPSTHDGRAESPARGALVPGSPQVEDGERRPRRHEQDVDQRGAHGRCRP